MGCCTVCAEKQQAWIARMRNDAQSLWVYILLFGPNTLLRWIIGSFNFCSCFSVFIKIQSSVSCYTRVNQLYFMSQVLPAQNYSQFTEAESNVQPGWICLSMRLLVLLIQNSSDWKIFYNTNSFQYCQFLEFNHKSVAVGFVLGWNTSVFTLCLREIPVGVRYLSCFFLPSK